MFNTFVQSFKLKNTYKANSIISALKSTPIIKNFLPSTLYANEGLKSLANFLSIINEILSLFIGKGIYLFLLVFLFSKAMKDASANSFIHVVFFLTLAGGIINTNIFDASIDKYYALFVMRMDANKYTLSNYLYYLLKIAVGFLPFTIIFGVLSKVPVGICLLIPLYVISVKLTMTALTLCHYKKSKKAKEPKLPIPINVIVITSSLITAYLMPILGYEIPKIFFLLSFIILAVLSTFSFRYIFKFQDYRNIYRSILRPDELAEDALEELNKASQLHLQSKIDDTALYTSNKTGYHYFNEIFMKRHSKLLTKSAKRISLIALGLLLTAVAACLVFPNIKTKTNEIITIYFPFSLFILYFINRGKIITEAMFVNCDHCMLSYRFYREPKAMLLLFVERLKYIVMINLIPAAVIGIGLPLILFVTGGTNNVWNYVMMAVSVIMMSVFFSIHNVVLYYLFQPYKIHSETKETVYNTVSYFTYFICYIASDNRMQMMNFAIAISLFCFIYAVLALILVYKLAPKTFKLRQ